MTGMQGMSGAAVAGGLVFLLVVLFAYPALLMVITRSVVKFRPGYWRCFGTVLLAAVIGAVIGFILVRVGHLAPAGWTMRGIGIVINFILITLFLHAFVKHPDEAPMDWGKTALSALIYVVIVTIISFAFTAVVHHMQATGALPMPRQAMGS